MAICQLPSSITLINRICRLPADQLKCRLPKWIKCNDDRTTKNKIKIQWNCLQWTWTEKNTIQISEHDGRFFIAWKKIIDGGYAIHMERIFIETISDFTNILHNLWARQTNIEKEYYMPIISMCVWFFRGKCLICGERRSKWKSTGVN